MAKESTDAVNNSQTPTEHSECTKTLKVEVKGTARILQHILVDIWYKKTLVYKKKGVILKLLWLGGSKDNSKRRDIIQFSVTSKISSQLVYQPVTATMYNLLHKKLS